VPSAFVGFTVPPQVLLPSLLVSVSHVAVSFLVQVAVPAAEVDGSPQSLLVVPEVLEEVDPANASEIDTLV
jgi:hypothetical protein